MKRRLRKKLGIGEFYQPGFTLYAKIGEASDDELDTIIDKLIKTVTELGMSCIGTVGEEVDLFVESGVVDGKNAERRDALIAAVGKMPQLTEVKAGELE